MFKNYIKTAWRNLLKGKVFNGLNILGLAVAIASSALLLLTVHFQFSYDKFHKNIDNIYQLYFSTNREGVVEKTGSMPVPVTPAIKAEYPEIKNISRLEGGVTTVAYGDKELEESINFVDQDFFKIFTIPVAAGSKTPLVSQNELVITKYVAKALFNNADPVGKMVRMKFGEGYKSFIVSSVIEDFPENSSINADGFIRFENTPGYQQNLKVWDNRNHSVFLSLTDNADPAVFESKLGKFVKAHFKEDLNNLKRDGAKPVANGDLMSLNLASFKDNHFNTEVGGVEGYAVNKTSIIGLLVIAIFILIIACINFINLAVARSFTRAREVGVRKTLGAGKWDLLSQFWTETIMVCLIALAIGIALASVILPYFNANFKSTIKLGMLFHPAQLLTLIGLFLLITVIAGFYPALLMMRYKTVQVLKGSVSTAKPGKVRNILLVVQFSIATLLTICTLITRQQINYVRNKPLGFNKSEVLSIPIDHGLNGAQALQLFRNQVAGEKQIVGVTGAYRNLGLGNDGSTFTSITGFNYKGHEIRSHIYSVSYDYLKTLDIKLLDGREFSKDFASDSNAVLVNQKMASLLQVNKPVGTMVPYDDKHPKKVIGVFADYNFRSLHDKIEPLTLVMDKEFPINYVFVRVRPNSLSASYDFIKEKWHQTFPNADFNASWLEQNTEKQYRNEQRLANIFNSASIIAIFISCIGLLAMSVMVILQRTKEIGIRKVLGASVSRIVLLVSSEFITLVIVAAIIAMPIAWWLMDQWLQNFAYRVSIQWWVFALATLLAVIIAALTISVQAIRAAIANPVKSIKSE
ncbi:ABC transporter permease [Mucilaginibacter sp. RS28]|uniref:ABC transporter permease n=1 Tax=Mucilaginibacter straminoryzae TaxID=2932774 RepID=A0A9X1X6I3_9SPHI|nr:ABC transporter permease [Mucilaginibacter straminoryzae]MCJ8211250.1 ABC transporter permease [Mucilaginibacter straminoryzae]